MRCKYCRLEKHNTIYFNSYTLMCMDCLKNFNVEELKQFYSCNTAVDKIFSPLYYQDNIGESFQHL